MSSITIIRLLELHAWPTFSIRVSQAVSARRVHVVGVEDDVGVGAAELQHDLLQVAPAVRGDSGAGPLGAGQRDALHSRVGDHRRDLVVGGEHVHVDPVGDAGVLHDSAMASADVGQFSACLRMTVLPTTRFGAANRATW